MTGRWWRAYDEALHDPKVIALSDRLHRAWFNLLCVASKNAGILPAIAIVAIELRVTTHKAAEYITLLVVAGLIDEIETGRFAPHNWGRRQFQSDVSTQRVKRFREQQRNVSSTVSETPPETDTEAETDTEGSLRSPPRTARRRRTLDPFPIGWILGQQELDFARSHGWSDQKASDEFKRFADHAAAHDRRQKDWQAAWRSWVTSPFQAKNGAGNGKRSLADVADELIARAEEREREVGFESIDSAFGSPQGRPPVDR